MTSNALATIDGLKNEILSIEETFNSMNSEIDFSREVQFAVQVLQKNKFLFETATRNPVSLRNAMVNVAAIGLSLNPALKFAYLVPRGSEVCLDIPFMGLTQIATDTGSIKWIQAEVVRKKDKFKFNGLGKEPTHSFNPFETLEKRGSIVGGYVVAKTKDDEFLCEVMSLEECHAIRDRTESWKAYKDNKIKTCPWLTDEAEMIKKTVIKRAYKRWPKSERLSSAVEILNQQEGINFDKEKQIRDVTPPEESELEILKRLAEEIDSKNGEARLLKHLTAKFKTKIESLEELNQEQTKYAIKFLKDMQLQNQGSKNENTSANPK